MAKISNDEWWPKNRAAMSPEPTPLRVGDRVRGKRTGREGHVSGLCDPHLGMVWVRWDGETADMDHVSDHLERLPTTSPRFKRGDRVVVRNDEWPGTVEAVGGSTTWVRFDFNPSAVAMRTGALVHFDESAGARTPADAEPPGPADGSPSDGARLAVRQLASPVSVAGGRADGTPALYPHTCLRCGAPAFHNAVTAECSRGAECNGRAEPRIVVTRSYSRSDEPAFEAWAEGAGWPFMPTVFAATEEAAIAAVKRRLGGGA